MNPLVSVSSVPGTSDHHLPADALTGCNIVILAGQNGFIVNDADKACKKANIPFISACTRGPVGWAFSNLQAHDYIIEVGLLVILLLGSLSNDGTLSMIYDGAE